MNLSQPWFHSIKADVVVVVVVVVDELRYEVPAWGQPPKILFTSCNGFHSDTERARYPGARAGEMWRRVNEQHWKSPFHLLIQGGDQIYADAIFKRVK